MREQARQCGANWSDTETLPLDLLGVEDLICEDWYATSTEESITAALDELLSSAGKVGDEIKAGSNSWRIFCGLPGLQTISHHQNLSYRTGEESFNLFQQVSQDLLL